jgi:hypothetical protein
MGTPRSPKNVIRDECIAFIEAVRLSVNAKGYMALLSAFACAGDLNIVEGAWATRPLSPQ